MSGCAGFAKMCGPLSWCHCDMDCAMAQIVHDWGDVIFTISAGDETLWTHATTGNDGLSCFDLDLTAQAYSQLTFAVDSHGSRSSDLGTWVDLKACQSDGCGTVSTCAQCKGHCGWCAGVHVFGAVNSGQVNSGHCSSQCSSSPATCAIGGGH